MTITSVYNEKHVNKLKKRKLYHHQAANLVMIFSRGSGGSPTASCFWRTIMSVAAFARSSTFLRSMPAVWRTSHHCFACPALS